MSPVAKFSIGLVAALLAAGVAYGPLGQGEAFVDGMQQRADAVIRDAALPNIRAQMSRTPLSRTVFLCGPANDFQRDGIRGFPGLDGRMLAVGGIGNVVWDPPAPAPRAVAPPCPPEGPGTAGGGFPLLAELLILAALAFLIGAGLGWLLFGRAPKGSYLGDY